MRKQHRRTGIYAVAALGGVVLPLVMPGSAWPSPANWISDTKTGCKLWNAAPLPKESVSWSGRCPGGVASGSGVAQWIEGGKPGQKYSGELIAGQANGRGVLIFANGDRYDGEWREGELDGRGTVTLSNGDTYSGDWVAGRRTGHGVYLHRGDDAFVYDGGFVDGKRFGHGVLRWRGASYDGEWRDDLPTGFGVLTNADGKTFAGMWKHGCLQDAEATVGVTRKQCGF